MKKSVLKRYQLKYVAIAQYKNYIIEFCMIIGIATTI